MNHWRYLLKRYTNDLHIAVPSLSLTTQISDLEEHDSSDCGICRTHAPGHPMTSMVCHKKILHAACIAKWLSEHNRCVYCRKEVIEIIVDGQTIPFGVNSVVSTIASTMSGLLVSECTNKKPSDPVLELHQSDVVCAERPKIRATMRDAQEKQAIKVNTSRALRTNTGDSVCGMKSSITG